MVIEASWRLGVLEESDRNQAEGKPLHQLSPTNKLQHEAFIKIAS